MFDSDVLNSKVWKNTAAPHRGETTSSCKKIFLELIPQHCVPPEIKRSRERKQSRCHPNFLHLSFIQVPDYASLSLFAFLICSVDHVSRRTTLWTSFTANCERASSPALPSRLDERDLNLQRRKRR